MSSKIGGTDPLRPRTAGIDDPLPTPAQHGHHHGHHRHGHFKGASFRHGGAGGPMRRGPTPRMPLRSAVKKKSARAKTSGTGHADDPEAESEGAHGHVPEEEHYRLRVASLPSQGDGSKNDSEEGDREEKRYARMFQLAPASVKRARPSGSLTVTGTTAETRPPALPPMHSTRELVQFIHSAIQGDATGQSLAATLRRINAAVMRGEINLPPVSKVAETRALLIEIFGKGCSGANAASSAVRNIHLMLPLWLINLSKRRSASQQLEAAARLSLPRKSFTKE